MNFGEWKAKLHENPGMICVDLWMFRYRNGIHEVLTHDGDIKEIKEGDIPDSNDYFARFEDREHLRTFADALASFGVKTDNDHRNEGLLEATKAHLEDMRRLVFDSKSTEIKEEL